MTMSPSYSRMLRQHLKQLNLLLVDDNYRIHAELYTLLSPMFKTLTMAHDAQSAMQQLHEHSIDLVISDIEMPGRDGLEFIKQLREADQNLPIIILSAYTDKDYLLQAANLQIDGYIVKPLNFNKLEETLSRAISRLPKPLSTIMLAPQVVYHPPIRSLTIDGKTISLGKKECLLLEYLIEYGNRVVSKEEIQQHIWPNTPPSDSALKNLLSELRKKLKYQLIQNHPGRGWCLEIEQQ